MVRPLKSNDTTRKMVRPQASGSSTVGDWFESGRDTDCLN